MKKQIKKIAAIIAALTLSAAAFAASKKSIVCITYPEYDWIMNILGDKAANFNVTLLQNNGTDLHSYQASIKDIAKISVCDMLVFVGGESDEWVEKAVAEAKNKNMVVVNMLEALGDKVKEEEVVEGMLSEEEEEEDDHDHDGHHHHHDEVEYDEHVWLSLRNAAALVQTLAQKISELDP
ncbi:MAG: zinc ABC transporter substrate-binding protein, partial [Treponema sp.]|nr:zinc ABC transporter substrate-binding protein [Treponema sp.]